MAIALNEARGALAANEVPVGAVMVRDGEVIARAGNTRHRRADPLGHAELEVLREAARSSGDWRLEGCTLYVTLEPCPMCVFACRQARLDLVVWGARDRRLGACGSVADLAEDPRFGPPLAHRGGLEQGKSRKLLEGFFAKRRRSS
jgi:tRNA(adenine34) deaminase